MVKKHGAQKPGKSQCGPDAAERESLKIKRRRIRTWTGQNEIRNVLGWMTTGATCRTLNSADSNEMKSLTHDCVRCREDK